MNKNVTQYMGWNLYVLGLDHQGVQIKKMNTTPIYKCKCWEIKLNKLISFSHY
jgi:hypothetical protein